MVLERADRALDGIRDIGFMGCDIPTEDLYWLLLPMAMTHIAGEVARVKKADYAFPHRPGEGKWDLMGYEVCEKPFNTMVGYNGSGGDDCCFWSYKIMLGDLWDRAGELTSVQATLLSLVLRSGGRIDETNAFARGAIEAMAARGFAEYADGPVRATFPVFTEDSRREWSRLTAALEDALSGEPVHIAATLHGAIEERVQRETPGRLTRQVRFVADSELCGLRMMALRHALAEGRIRMPDNPGRSTIAMYLQVGTK